MKPTINQSDMMIPTNTSPWPSGVTATLISTNCAPAAYRSDGVIIYGSQNHRGVWDIYNTDTHASMTAPGWPLVYTHRGVSDLKGDLALIVASPNANANTTPGKGVSNDLHLLDLATSQITALLSGPTGRKGIIWARWHPTLSRIVWAEFTGPAPNRVLQPFGYWQLHTADIVGNAIANEVIQSALPTAFYEPYGWMPDGQTLLFASDAGQPSWETTTLSTMPDIPGATPTQLVPANGYHEFAFPAPAGMFDDGEPSLLIGWAIGTLQSFALGLELYRLVLASGETTRLTYFQAAWGLGVGAVAFHPTDPKRLAVAFKTTQQCAYSGYELVLP